MARQNAHAEYDPVLRDFSSSTLSGKESLLDETVATPGWRVYTDLVEAMVDQITEALLERAGLPSHEEYIQAHSKAKGLRLALVAPEALARKAAQTRAEAESHA